MTLREAHTAATLRFAADPHLRDHASRDATMLILHALGLPRTALHADPGRLLSSSETTRIDNLIARRLTHEPTQYILGQQEFFGLTFRVTPATLIPRPETELLVEAVLERLPHDRPLRIADIGTGSGAIAIALAHHLRAARIEAVDLSPAALAVARENATTHLVDDRIRFILSDLLAPIPQATGFDAVVSNPPYVPEADRCSLHPQVRDHEPAVALFAGPDGLAIYRRLIPQAWKALQPGSLLALELGYGQSQAVRSMLAAWQDLEVLNDLQDIPRIALARTPA